jgi:enoyl-CoA hydratase/carnithine racemase
MLRAARRRSPAGRLARERPTHRIRGPHRDGLDRREGHIDAAAPADDDVLLIEDLGPVRRFTMNRPKALNALSSDLLGALSDGFAAAARDEAVRVVVLRGAGRAFCSGYDLSEDAEAGAKDAAGWHRELRDAAAQMVAIVDHPKPVVAQVHGYCLAGGCDLMMCCDLCVCSDDARFGEPEIRFGSGVVTMIMPWLIGVRAAKELLFTGEDRITAEEARRIGLVNRVVPRDELDDAALALATEIAKNDPFAVSMEKAAINRVWEVAGFREAIASNVELDALIEAADLPERAEFRRITLERGLKAAIAWRDARFRERLG